MKKLLASLVLTFALGAFTVAVAQDNPTATKKECKEAKAEGKKCCKAGDEAKVDGKKCCKAGAEAKAEGKKCCKSKEKAETATCTKKAAKS